MAKQLKLFESVSSASKSSKPPSTPNKLKKSGGLKSDRIKELQALVKYHQHLYYNSQPEISDEEFDKLWDELKNLDPNNEVFSKVGADFDTSLDKVRLLIPMNSQAKVTSPAEFSKWDRKKGYSQFITQFKLDGISVELQYLKGKFQHGVTRGDGVIGNDIFLNSLHNFNSDCNLRTHFYAYSTTVAINISFFIVNRYCNSVFNQYNCIFLVQITLFPQLVKVNWTRYNTRIATSASVSIYF